ncbi:MAG: hypothetical protein IEMM0006_0460 [bacterium]|nr:MAG: hypothetical protein IEMM0006_0460 [bacterium]
MKKKKRAWHVTTALHNSRYSQRMFDNHVKPGAVIRLEEKDEILITGVVADIVKEDNLNVIEYNMCGDHMHLLIVCEKEELSKIVGKIKSMTARACNIAMGRTMGQAPLSEEVPSSGRGKTQTKLWTQKFGKSEIRDERYLNNAITYIRNNRIKHHLPRSERMEQIKKEFLCTKKHAFRTEY